jgi:hypothetical protein
MEEVQAWCWIMWSVTCWSRFRRAADSARAKLAFLSARRFSILRSRRPAGAHEMPFNAAVRDALPSCSTTWTIWCRPRRRMPPFTALIGR